MTNFRTLFLALSTLVVLNSHLTISGALPAPTEEKKSVKETEPTLDEIVGLFVSGKGKAKINRQNAQGQTTLHIAVKTLSLRMVHALLRHGADITIKDAQGLTPKDLITTILDYFILQLEKARSENAKVPFEQLLPESIVTQMNIALDILGELNNAEEPQASKK